MNTLVLVLMTSCPVAADPVQVAPPPAAPSYDASVSRPGRFGKIRSWFHRSPPSNPTPGQPQAPSGAPGSPVYAPAPPPVVPPQTVPGSYRYPTTAEPPLAPTGPTLTPPPGR
jgi:hypothetical protein